MQRQCQLTICAVRTVPLLWENGSSCRQADHATMMATDILGEKLPRMSLLRQEGFRGAPARACA